MAYNITLTNGTNLVTVADGTIVNDYTSLTLVGKNFAGYGSFLNENFVKLLENFANTTEPPNALQGQIWWDTTNKVLRVRSGAVWKTVSSSTTSAVAPGGATVGDLWWDVANGQLNVWSGSQWVVIGPSYTATQKKTGAIADSVVEVGGTGVSHIVVKFYVNDVLVAILSKDPSFTVSGLTGFNIINPGFNLSSVGNLGYYGNANNALNLAGVAAEHYLRSDRESTTNFKLNVKNDAGFTVGNNADLIIGVSNAGTTPAINFIGDASKDINFITGTGVKMLSIGGTAGRGVLVSADPNENLGVATKQYVDNQVHGSSSPVLLRDGTNTITGVIKPDTNGTKDFGSATAKFGTVYATTFNGVATDCIKLGGIDYNTYVRNDITNVFPETIIIEKEIVVGENADFTIKSTATDVDLIGNTLGKGIVVKLTPSNTGVVSSALSINGATGLVSVFADPTSALGVASKQYVDSKVAAGGTTINLGSVTSNIIPSANLTYHIGTSTAQWTDVWATTFHGNASTANYADLAERFEADETYLPGTVVELGGTAEVTAAMIDRSENVFGVISTNAAYLMNAGAGSNSTHPPIAMQGRVPVRVIGKVTKGDRLVSAGNGLARAATKDEITPFNVIGRALATKETVNEGTVEAIVKINS